MNFLAIIPARYASSRFPGKPLADMLGKPMIQRVYEQVHKAVDEVWVATDDNRIYQAVTAFGGKAVMTSPLHKSGTDRCYEALTRIAGAWDVVINIQGDEPFIHPDQIQSIKACFDAPQTDIATLVKPFTQTDGLAALENPNSPKVVLGKEQQALYFSRSVIPFLRGIDKQTWLSHHTFYKHIGMYAYRVSVLKEITQLPQGILEQQESLEQLRWLENGYRITTGISQVETIGIDTPEDMQHALTELRKQAAL